MFNMGFTEILFIAVLALVLIGPKQLPEVARTLGRFLNELKRSTDTIKDEFKSAAFKSEDIYNPDQPNGHFNHQLHKANHEPGPYQVTQTDDDIKQLELTALDDKDHGKKNS